MFKNYLYCSLNYLPSALSFVRLLKMYYRYYYRLYEGWATFYTSWARFNNLQLRAEQHYSICNWFLRIHNWNTFFRSFFKRRVGVSAGSHLLTVRLYDNLIYFPLLLDFHRYFYIFIYFISTWYIKIMRVYFRSSFIDYEVSFKSNADTRLAGVNQISDCVGR